MPSGVRGRWVLLVLWVAVIYAASPFAWPIGRAILDTPLGAWALGREGATAMTVLVALGVARWLYVRGAPFTAFALFAGAAAGAALTLRVLTEQPIERIHLPEYGIVAWLAWRALRVGGASVAWANVGAFGLTSLAGLGDEVVQLMLPSRYFDWRDVTLNAASGAVALLLIAAVRKARRLS